MKSLSAFAFLAAFLGTVRAQAEFPITIQTSVQPPFCLDVKGGNADGTPVDINTCSDPGSRKWTLTSSGQIKIAAWNKCLDVTNGNNVNGNKVQLWTCAAGNKNQIFSYDNIDGSFHWKDKCLDITDGKPMNGYVAGTRIQIWECGLGNPNQLFDTVYFPPNTPPTTDHVIHPQRDTTKCLQGGIAPSDPITIQNCDGSNKQVWQYTGSTNTLLQKYPVPNPSNPNVHNFYSLCLDVTGGSTLNGAKPQVYTCFNGNTNQKWLYTGDHRIQWFNKGECLDLTNGNTAPGTVVQMWKCTNNNLNQFWTVV